MCFEAYSAGQDFIIDSIWRNKWSDAGRPWIHHLRLLSPILSFEVWWEPVRFKLSHQMKCFPLRWHHPITLDVALLVSVLLQTHFLLYSGFLSSRSLHICSPAVVPLRRAAVRLMEALVLRQWHCSDWHPCFRYGRSGFCSWKCLDIMEITHWGRPAGGTQEVDNNCLKMCGNAHNCRTNPYVIIT